MPASCALVAIQIAGLGIDRASMHAHSVESAAAAGSRRRLLACCCRKLGGCAGEAANGIHGLCGLPAYNPSLEVGWDIELCGLTVLSGPAG